jgi:hypothetical protein
MLPNQGLAIGFEWIPPDRPLVGLQHRRFVMAIPDGDPPVPPPSRQLLTQLMALRNTPLVISSYPDDALLMRLDPVGRLHRMEEGEITRGPLGLHRRRADGWYSISYDPQALKDISALVGWQKAEQAGQARFVLADLNQSRLTDWIVAVTRDRLSRASYQSARAMNQITYDLQLTPSESQGAAELLLGAEQS